MFNIHLNELNKGCRESYNNLSDFSECEDRFYGTECTESCGHCSDDDVCDKLTGHCPNRCQSDFKPPLCQGIYIHDYTFYMIAKLKHFRFLPLC